MENLIPNKNIFSIHKQVVSEIVDHDLCIGCGICVGICPSKLLDMSWQDNGDLAPEIEGQCPPSCDACLRVCPFGDHSLVEETIAKKEFGGNKFIRKDPDLGFYLATFVGYSLAHDHRRLGASGGMMTWFLETLLESKKVDAIVSVNQSRTEEELFEYQVLNGINEVRSLAGSVYHPVDMATAIAQMDEKDNEKKYAIVGLPCFIKSVKLAMQTMPRLRRRVKFTLGLACGHLPNKFYTEYLAEVSGIRADDISSVNYRVKKNTSRAGNYKFQASSKTTQPGSELAFSDISNIWGAGYFGMNACNFCDDVFAELADVTVMDAWLPEYENDVKGNSLIILRNKQLLSILQGGIKEKTCRMSPILGSQVAKSQNGVTFHKKKLLEARLFWAYSKGLKIPQKRVKPKKTSYQRYRWQVKSRFAVQNASKKLWPLINKNYVYLLSFYLYFLSIPVLLFKLFVRLSNLIKNPRRVLLLLKRK